MKKLIEKLIPIDDLMATVKRFPLSVFSSVCIFILVFLSIHDVLDFKDENIFRLMSVFGCLYFWFGISKLIGESQKLSLVKLVLVSIIPAIGITALLLTADIWGLHLLFLWPALLLILMFSPYLKRGDDLSVWFFNRQLWFGAAVSYIALMLFAGGISAAFVAIDELFGVNIEGEFYADIWSFAGFVLGPVYALSWVPKQFVFTEDDCRDPPGLKFIANWISVPMVFVYLAILYAYFGKMVLEQTVPNGILAYLISGFVGAGVVTYLVSWPLREVGSAQLRLFHKIFFPALIIPVGFHFFAIWGRIGAYGVTEQRYFILLSAVWFMMIALGNLFQKMPIKAIPATLAILLLFASFGPWGAVSVSGVSQYSRLEGLLVKHDLVKDGTVQKAEVEIPFEDRVSISSIVDYLCDTQRHEMVYRIFQTPEKEYERNRCYAHSLVKDQLGFDYTYRSRQNRDDHISIWGNSYRQEARDIRQYDYFIKNGNIKKGHKPCKGDSCPEESPDYVDVFFDDEKTLLRFKRGDSILLEENIHDFVMDNRSRQNRDESLYLELENENIVVRMDVLSAYGKMDGDKPIINSMNYDLFYRFKDVQ